MQGAKHRTTGDTTTTTTTKTSAETTLWILYVAGSHKQTCWRVDQTNAHYTLTCRFFLPPSTHRANAFDQLA